MARKNLIGVDSYHVIVPVQLINRKLCKSNNKLTSFTRKLILISTSQANLLTFT